MQITSILAIYFLFWVFTAFVMLPFGVQTADEAGVPKVPGQADSAPVNFRPGRLALRATVLAAGFTTLFVLNYEFGWVTVEDIDFLPKPPSRTQA
jgi:predicted secreted protein